jgi:hypothetical protein
VLSAVREGGWLMGANADGRMETAFQMVIVVDGRAVLCCPHDKGRDSPTGAAPNAASALSRLMQSS